MEKHLETDRPILIVEDSDDDYDAAVRALRKELALPHPLRRCEDGKQALDYLLHDCAAKSTFPMMILLDLNLPGIDGRAVLSEIKSHDRLRCIPIIVMTHSDAQRDIRDCYRMGANSYVRKPLEWPRFVTAMKNLKGYWIDTAILPEI
jgi:two-component system, response regulator